MGKSLINVSGDIAEKMGMLKELMTLEWENEEEREVFAREIVKSIVGDEVTMVHKVQNITAFIDRIDDDVARARKWKDDITKQIGVAENMKARIKEYALFVLKAVCKSTGQKYIEDGDVRISYQPQGDKAPLVITDESMIPNSFYDEREEVIKTRTLNKARLKEAIQSGVKIEGAYIAPQAEGIRIKTILPKDDK